MPRDKKISLNVTQPMMVYNPVKLYQMEALQEVVKKFTVIDQFSARFLLWLLENTARLTRPLYCQIPSDYSYVGADLRRITDVWHFNLVLQCMDSFMRLYVRDSDIDGKACVIQISIKPNLSPEHNELLFDPEKITSIVL